MYALLVSPLFFFNDTATTEIYTLSLHDALPIFLEDGRMDQLVHDAQTERLLGAFDLAREDDVEGRAGRSEEHTSELQSLAYLVCRLLLEKKKELANQYASQLLHVVPAVTARPVT